MAKTAAHARRGASLRRRITARRRTQAIDLGIPGAADPLRILAPAHPDAVLDELATSFTTALIAEASGEPPTLSVEPHMPYWATPWASGLALAELVLADPEILRGRRVLELGCGLGVTAVAALKVGARLTIADCFAEALAYCRANALTNVGADARSLLADWRSHAGRRLLQRFGPFDVALAADVLYESDDVEPLLDLIPALLVPAGAFWLAEPGRATSTAFVAAAREAGWREEGVETLERDWPAGAGHARVVVHRYAMPAPPPTAALAPGCESIPTAR